MLSLMRGGTAMIAAVTVERKTDFRTVPFR
jgi:hypothetical protein